jgi:ketosteroid isomerase-like protein
MRIRFALSLVLLLTFSLGSALAAKKPAPSPTAAATAAPAAAAEASPLAVVQKLYEALNRHDVEAMLTQIHPDIQWLTVNGDQIIGNAAGHNAVRELLSKTLGSYSGLRKTIEQSMVEGPLVSVVEQAQWKGRSGELKQSTLVVYHVEDGKILHAWTYSYRHKG